MRWNISLEQTSCANSRSAYDGQRAQVHRLADGSVEIFSRHMERHTEKYPDICSLLGPATPITDATTFVLDSEVVAYDTIARRILPFQTLSTRGRKGVKEEGVTVTVCVFVFDLLYFDGQSLLQTPLSDRRALLHANFRERAGVFQYAQSITSRDGDEITSFLNEALAASCEGIMAKALVETSTYEPSKRSDSWLKIKKDYIDGMVDSFDLVPIGAWHGTGRRAGWYSPFLLACWDPASETYQAMTKCMTGFTDAQFREFLDFFSQEGRTLQGPRAYYSSGMVPDVWFDACQVWEVRGADLTLSPVHKAAMGLVTPDRGISLRFPRFIRTRSDKAIEDATTSETIADMYRKGVKSEDVGPGSKSSAKKEGDEEEEEDDDDYDE